MGTRYSLPFPKPVTRMPTRATATSPGVLEGRLTNLRVAIPVVRGSIRFLIDGVPVVGTVENPEHIRTLRTHQERRTPVRVGVMTDSLGAHRFAWLICPGKAGVPPRYYKAQRRMNALAIAGGLVLAAAALALAWSMGTGSIWRALTLAVSSAVALAGLVLAGVAVHALGRSRLMRSALLQSEAQFQQDDGRPAKAAALRDAPAQASPQNVETLLADDGRPAIARVRGALTAVTHESIRSMNGGPSYGVYRFVVGKQPYVMRVGEDIGNVTPFLAEGDQVELAVHPVDLPGGDPHRIVYALRNVEDGRVYVCHRTFRGGRAAVAPIGVGLSQRVPLLRTVAGYLFVCWVMILGVFAFTDLDSSGFDALPLIAAWAFAACLGVWLGVALPFVYLHARWRNGRPTTRQRTLERVYLALGLGTPFEPTAPVEEM